MEEVKSLISLGIDLGGDRGTMSVERLDSIPTVEECIDLVAKVTPTYASEQPRGYFIDIQNGDDFQEVFTYDCFSKQNRYTSPSGKITSWGSNLTSSKLAFQWVTLISSDNFLEEIKPLLQKVYLEELELVEDPFLEDTWSSIQYKGVYIDVNFYLFCENADENEYIVYDEATKTSSLCKDFDVKPVCAIYGVVFEDNLAPIDTDGEIATELFEYLGNIID